MPGEVPHPPEEQPLPVTIGAAVLAHYMYEKMAGYPLPSPDNPDAVLDVARTVMNHTDMPPEEVAGWVPQIKGLMHTLHRDIGRLEY